MTGLKVVQLTGARDWLTGWLMADVPVEWIDGCVGGWVIRWLPSCIAPRFLHDSLSGWRSIQHSQACTDDSQGKESKKEIMTKRSSDSACDWLWLSAGLVPRRGPPWPAAPSTSGESRCLGAARSSQEPESARSSPPLCNVHPLPLAVKSRLGVTSSPWTHYKHVLYVIFK